MGIHRERLAASRAHQRCIAGFKQAVRSMGLEVPGPSDISPKIIGAQPLPFPVPPVLEEALSLSRESGVWISPENAQHT